MYLFICFMNRREYKEVIVVVGTTVVTSTNGSRITDGIQSWSTHRKFMGIKGSDHDIALIQMKDSFVFTKKINYIQLMDSDSIEVKDKVTMMGFGLLTVRITEFVSLNISFSVCKIFYNKMNIFQGNLRSSSLQELTKEIINPAECQSESAPKKKLLICTEKINSGSGDVRKKDQFIKIQLKKF